MGTLNGSDNKGWKMKIMDKTELEIVKEQRESKHESLRKLYQHNVATAKEMKAQGLDNATIANMMDYSENAIRMFLKEED